MASTLLQLGQIELVGNPLVTSMLYQAKERVLNEFQDARERAMQSLLMADFDHAAEGVMFFSNNF